MFWLKILIIIVFGIIFWQDGKERLVYWFLYPLLGILGFSIQLFYSDLSLIFINSAINLFFIITIVLILWVYTKLILKKDLLNKGIGIGDLLLFGFLSFCFSIISFFILFVFSLIFSLSLFLILKRKKTETESIPLAGFMSVFFAVVYLLTFFINCNFIFAY